MAFRKMLPDRVRSKKTMFRTSIYNGTCITNKGDSGLVKYYRARIKVETTRCTFSYKSVFDLLKDWSIQ